MDAGNVGEVGEEPLEPVRVARIVAVLIELLVREKSEGRERYAATPDLTGEAFGLFAASAASASALRLAPRSCLSISAIWSFVKSSLYLDLPCAFAIASMRLSIDLRSLTSVG